MQTFTNQAQLSYNGIITNSNIATGTIIQVLSAAKTAIPDSYGVNDLITYVVTLSNTGATSLTGLTVTDDLGGYAFTPTTGTQQTLYPLTYVPDSVRYFRDGQLQAAPTVTTDAGFSVTGISVPANGNSTIVYQARVNEYAPLDPAGTIVNTATVTGGSITTPVTATNTLPVRNEPYLTIFKSLTPVQVPENGQVTYTFDIQNYGNTAADAADNVRVLDTFTPVLNDITVTLNGTALEAADYTYDETSGQFATNAGVITVPAATFAQNADGVWTTTPGSATLVVTGTI